MDLREAALSLCEEHGYGIEMQQRLEPVPLFVAASSGAVSIPIDDWRHFRIFEERTAKTPAEVAEKTAEIEGVMMSELRRLFGMGRGSTEKVMWRRLPEITAERDHEHMAYKVRGLARGTLLPLMRFVGAGGR